MRHILILCVSVLISACTTKPTTPIVITEYKNQVVSIPDALLQKCAVTVPPDKAQYVNSSDNEKEDILVTYTQNLLTDLDNCNTQILQIKSINDQYVESYSRKK